MYSSAHDSIASRLLLSIETIHFSWADCDALLGLKIISTIVDKFLGNIDRDTCWSLILKNKRLIRTGVIFRVDPEKGASSIQFNKVGLVKSELKSKMNIQSSNRRLSKIR